MPDRSRGGPRASPRRGNIPAPGARPPQRLPATRLATGRVGPVPPPVRAIAAAISSRSAAVSSSVAAPIQPSTCPAVRAPTIAPVTPGHASVHATAMARDRGAVPPRDRLQRVPQCEIAAQVRLLELHGATPPVVLSERGDTGPREAVRQEARLHRAVHDHAGVVPGTPRNLVSRGLAPDEGEGRLQRIHVAEHLAPLEQRDVEVRDARGPHVAFLDESHHRMPGVLHGRPRLVGPVELIEVDALDAEPPERRLALLSDGIRTQHPPRFLHTVALVPHQPALGEHEWAVARWQLPQETTDQLFGMTEAVHRGGIDAVDA